MITSFSTRAADWTGTCGRYHIHKVVPAARVALTGKAVDRWFVSFLVVLVSDNASKCHHEASVCFKPENTPVLRHSELNAHSSFPCQAGVECGDYRSNGTGSVSRWGLGKPGFPSFQSKLSLPPTHHHPSFSLSDQRKYKSSFMTLETCMGLSSVLVL